MATDDINKRVTNAELKIGMIENELMAQQALVMQNVNSDISEK